VNDVAGPEKELLMKKWHSFISVPIMALIASCSRTAERPVNAGTVNAPVAFHSLSAKDLEGKLISFDQYEGKTILVVNTASECGYTRQYEKLEKLHRQYAGRLVVLGFPSDDFGGQEPGDAAQIRSFCTQNFGVTFPMFEKVRTSGRHIAPVFSWLTDKSKNGWNTQSPTWNFCKYLIDGEGQLLAFFPASVEPDDPAIIRLIK